MHLQPGFKLVKDMTMKVSLYILLGDYHKLDNENDLGTISYETKHLLFLKKQKYFLLMDNVYNNFF